MRLEIVKRWVSAILLWLSLRHEGLWDLDCVSDTLELHMCAGPKGLSVYGKNIIKMPGLTSKGHISRE